MTQRIGILGGTFDPVHQGHVASAVEIADAFSLDRVLLVLSARPPHKPDAHPAPIEHRLAMLALAARADPRIEASDIEVRRPGPSYTVDTLSALARRCPEAALYLIVGIDAYRDIDTWSRPESLLRLANIIVTNRPGLTDEARPKPPVAARNACCYDPTIDAYVHESGHQLVFHSINGVEVSATEIRNRIRRGLPVHDLTGPAVARYIAEHGLYGTSIR